MGFLACLNNNNNSLIPTHYYMLHAISRKERSNGTRLIYSFCVQSGLLSFCLRVESKIFNIAQFLSLELGANFPLSFLDGFADWLLICFLGLEHHVRSVECALKLALIIF